MQELFENTYIFSNATVTCGELIAYRARGEAKIGEDIFKLLGINKREYDFWIECRRSGTDSTVILRGKRKGRDTAVVFAGHPFSVTACFVMEICEDICNILRKTFGRGMYGVYTSDGVKTLLECCPIEENNGAVGIAYQIDGIDMAYEILDARAAIPVHLIECAKDIARLACVSLNFLNEDLPTVLEYGKVFVPGVYLSVISVMAFVAREYSKTRALDLEILSDCGDMCVRMSFEIYDTLDKRFCEYLRGAASAFGCPIALYEKDGRFVCEHEPYADDYSQQGLKHPIFTFADMEEGIKYFV